MTGGPPALANRRPTIVPHLHPASPRATAIRGTRRSSPDLRRLIPPALDRELASAAISAGSVDPSTALVLWNVGQRAVLQPLLQFAIPHGIELRQARRIGTYQGARSRMGHFATIRDGMAIMLEVESREEHGWLRLLSMEPGVTWLHTQPFVLIWPDIDGGSIIHIPDILALRYQQPVVIDIKPTDLVDDYDRVIFHLTQTTLDCIDADYRTHGDLSKQAKASLLSIRRNRNINPRFDHLVHLLMNVRPATAYHALQLCGSPSVGRTVLFHLVANAICRIPLDEPIHRSTPIEWVVEWEIESP